MKLILTLALFLSSQTSSAGDSPHEIEQCQKLLQHYNDFWRHDASEYLYRMLDRGLFWKFDAKEPDPELAELFFQGRTKASGTQTRLRVVKDTLSLEIRDRSTNNILLHELGPTDLVTHTEATRFANGGNDDNQVSSLAFAARSYAYVHYPLARTQDLVLSVQVLPYQVDESIFLGRRTRCTNSEETAYWFNSQGERFCFRSLAQLATSPD